MKNNSFVAKDTVSLRNDVVRD